MKQNLKENSIRLGVLGIAGAINLAGVSIGGRFGEALGNMGTDSNQNSLTRDKAIAENEKKDEIPSP